MNTPSRDVTAEILKCKANIECDEWKHLVVSTKSTIQTNMFPYCSPVDQIRQIFQENPNNSESLQNGLNRVTHSYYCLHLYAMNLHGNPDSSYYKQIKVSNLLDFFYINKSLECY